jgi:hypothetical protein
MITSIDFHNEYGHVVLTPVTSSKPVRDISRYLVPVDCFVTLEQAEQVAAITENRRVQLCFPDLPQCYVVFHPTPCTAQICRAAITWNAAETARSVLSRPTAEYLL